MVPRRPTRERGGIDDAPPRRARRSDGRVLLTDGGAAEGEEAEGERVEDEGAEGEQAEGGEAETDEEAGDDGAEAGDDGSEASDDGSESEDEEEMEGGDESEPDESDEEGVESEEGDESEPDEDREAESDEDEEGSDEGEHGGDAETVYESEEASGVLHLDLDGLFLDLLGLEVNLNEVTLDVSARPGENNLLGNLLSAVTGLLRTPGQMLDGLTDRITGAVGRVTDALSGLVPGAGGDGEEGDAEGEEDEGGVASSIAGWIASIPSRIGGWIRGALSEAASALPLEEVIATVVRETVRALVERSESAAETDEGASEEGGEPAEAES